MGMEIGSCELTFIPAQSPNPDSDLAAAAPSAAKTESPHGQPPGQPRAHHRTSRVELISADSAAASALLILQAILPYILFSNASPNPVELEISGGTNVAFSPSYEYLDQVLLPALLHRFGISVERRLLSRGWSLGPQSRGAIWVRVQPLQAGDAIKAVLSNSDECTKEVALSEKRLKSVSNVNTNIIAPLALLDDLQASISTAISITFPNATINPATVEDSQHNSRIYILLVAQNSSGLLRWGRDVLMSTPRAKGRKTAVLPAEAMTKVARNLCRELREEVVGGIIDSHLQDQLVCFQALADGVSAISRREVGDDEDEEWDIAMRALNLDKGHGKMIQRIDSPFGDGSMHAQTARWIAAQILPKAEFYQSGVCKGVGYSCG